MPVSAIQPTDPIKKRELRVNPDPFDKDTFFNNFDYLSSAKSDKPSNLVRFLQEYVFGVSEKNPEVINWVNEIASGASNDESRRLLALGSLGNYKMFRSKNVDLVIVVLAKYIDDPSPRVQEEIIKSLGESENVKALPIFEAKLANGSALKVPLLNAIDRLNNTVDRDISRLCDSLVFAKDESERIKSKDDFLQTYIKSCGQGRALANLARIAQGSRSYQCIHAMQLLKEIDPYLGLDALIGVLKIRSTPTTEKDREMFGKLVESLRKK